MGACDQNTVNQILDFFHAQGGNFIDTANNYQDEESEMWIGEWMKSRGVRDQMGKYPFPYHAIFSENMCLLRASDASSKCSAPSKMAQVVCLHGNNTCKI